MHSNWLTSHSYPGVLEQRTLDLEHPELHHLSELDLPEYRQLPGYSGLFAQVIRFSEPFLRTMRVLLESIIPSFAITLVLLQ